KTKLADLEGIAVINPRGINAIKTNQMRRRLRDKGLRMTVVKNTLARRATSQTKIDGFDKLLDGPSAVIYGKGTVSAIARILLDEKKSDEAIELRGLFFDGEIYEGQSGVETASKLPTREEAIGQVLALILSPGKNLGGIFKGQAGKVAALIKSVEEKAKEKEGAAPAAA
ncbi:MAG TPA: 50S ribosomal protein L10, partial [Tepidisphaeraceae bacterium]|nr:50S ribosomal protein L10 [Tepidisphaeraceae bacterium]